MKINKCRICNSGIARVLSLGRFPAVNYYLTLEDLKKKEKKYPLNFCICETCGLGQLDEIVKADDLFSTYHYISSTSEPLKKHLESLGRICEEKFGLGNESKVLDIGCNDGTLLSYFKNHGISCLGVDPAENIVKQARETGLRIISDFFSKKLSYKILKKEEQFDLIVATNTLAQIVDLGDFVSGVKNILKPRGSLVIEVGYLPEMLLRGTFDSIYHEHYSYFSLMSLKYLFENNQLKMYDAEQIGNHGGSIRVFVSHEENIKRKQSIRLKRLLKTESKLRINNKKTYAKFVESALRFKKEFNELLTGLKINNKTIVGIGAPAKSVILLNFAEVNHTLISYITDSTIYKQNRFMPGVHIPIVSEDKLIYDNSIDYFVLLAWTYKDAVMKKLSALKKANTKIIVPFPKLQIL